MKTREQIAASIERSIGTALPTLFFSDDELRVIVRALRPEELPSELLDKAIMALSAHYVEELPQGEPKDAWNSAVGYCIGTLRAMQDARPKPQDGRGT